MFVMTLLYIVLAALGLGLLIFIHEYGHYWVAKREGMTVEAFSIGFGKPIYVWYRGSVRWQLCWLPFGGYVRIAGMEKQGTLEPHEVQDGFYAKTPFARIRVALAGPFVNIAFAFVIFSLLFLMGGRQKPFSDYTHLIGSMDRESGLYESGVRAGNVILTINGNPFHNFQDFIYAAVLERSAPVITGDKVDYLRGTKEPFTYRFHFPKKASLMEKMQLTAGVVRPASYLIYSSKGSISLNRDTPMKNSGIEDGDRVLWVDGELLFSREQLVRVVNEQKAFLTIKRGGQTLLVRTPRLKVTDLRIAPQQRAELEDWAHEAGVNSRVNDLFFIPYNLNNRAVVEGGFSYLNEKSVEEKPSSSALQKGDQIIAVDGFAVKSSYAVMKQLQERHVQLIVKNKEERKIPSWKKADALFLSAIPLDDLKELTRFVGQTEGVKELGSLKLLKPIKPVPLIQMPLSAAKREVLEVQMEEERKQIEEIKEPKSREAALELFEQEHSRLKLGIITHDLPVIYNPAPTTLFVDVIKETGKTLYALFTGSLAPKYLSGPVGIVQVMQRSWGYGVKEAIFWLGMISLNLGIFNLLPIPVLDGGHICFSIWEKITGKPLSSKVRDRFIIPFVILLIALFIYLTYNDLARIFTGLF